MSITTTAIGTTRVVVAAGLRLSCDAYVSCLSPEDDLQVIAAPGTARFVLESLRPLAPGVVVVDPKALGDPDLSLFGAIRANPTPPALVALVALDDPRLAMQLYRDGTAALVTKTASVDELIGAIRLAARGESWISPPLLRGILELAARDDAGENGPLGALTVRETEILQLMVDGLGRREIASSLFLSVDTIRTHVRTMFEKLGVHSSTGAVSVGLVSGLRPGRLISTN